MAHFVEALEVRTLLSGNVAAVVRGDNLIITGDAESNSVQVHVTGTGVVVTGLDGTTVNDAADPFVAFPGETSIAGRLVIRLGAGDDVAFLSGALDVAGDVVVTGGDGADRVGLEDVTIGGKLIVRGRSGDDGLSVQDSTIGGRLVMAGGAGDDTLALLNSQVDGKLRFAGGGGADVAHVDDTALAGGAVFALGADADGVFLEDSQVGARLRVSAGTGDDFVMFEATTVEGPTVVRARAGNDALVLTGANHFNGEFRANGGPGEDAEDINPESVFDVSPISRGFELDDVAAAVITARLDTPGTGVRARAKALRDLFIALP